MSKSPNAVVKRIVERVSSELDAAFHATCHNLLDGALPEDLAALPTEILAASVRQAQQTIVASRGTQSTITIEQHTAGDGHSYASLAIVNPDRPFLYDSVLGEINSQAHNVLLAVHPIMDVSTDNSQIEIRDHRRSGIITSSQRKMSVIQVVIEGADTVALAQLRAGIEHVVRLVTMATDDWQPMVERLEVVIADWQDGILPARKADVDEAISFLKWLRDDNFVLLGMRDYDYSGGEKRGRLERASTPSLGILADPEVRVLIRDNQPVTTTPQIRAFLNSRDLLIIAKANTKSVVHRRAYLDYIGIKRYDSKGKLVGETRIVGLFTQTAYNRSVTAVPYVRSKVDAVLKRAAFDPESHSGKTLINVLETYPRDELFQIDIAQLRRNCEAIMALADRPKVRVLPRIDPFDRFVSVLVFVPRERYDTSVRERIGELLANAYDGHVSAFYPAFLEGILTRVHFIIGRSGDKTPSPSVAGLEQDVVEIIRTWSDRLAEDLSRATSAISDQATRFRFPLAYREEHQTERTVADIGYLAGIDKNAPIAVDFYRPDNASDNSANLRIFHGGEPVALSRRVPVLENMGFRVISESTHAIDVSSGDFTQIWLHDMTLLSASGQPIDMTFDDGAVFEEGFRSIWSGQADNDPYNALMLSAGLTCRQTTILRAIGRYLKQAGAQYSQAYMAQTLARHADYTKRLFELFQVRFNPAAKMLYAADDATVVARHIRASLDDLLADVTSIDEDTILRRFVETLDAMLRTNYFAPEDDGSDRRTLAFKLDPGSLTFLPEPRPHREIFVYGTEVEGVHLRFGPVARGGLRWSDRAEDYRTEVLGLVKAQQVKNAVIVPVGAKGGFLPKALPKGGDRDAVFSAGRQAYIAFVSAMLSITDNIVDDVITHPQDVICLDGNDPYLVVAADKGTATFSDTANGISMQHGFWLDDAFASGGSAGYDHKAMGITARGAWEAVKRHFREMDKNIQEEPFTVAGVGDMSGDVFGNGMLLSKHIRLIAAFDHRDIFIDPDPDPASSFKERERLFQMGRSSWQDYDPTTLSTGGGVFPRNQKFITLSRQAADAIGLSKTRATPNEVMAAILSAPVELMWFGGIGTYVRASHESNTDVGDRANDAIRISARQLRAKVVGEGANLGMTQFARIEYGKHGGRCNSDAIDNSAGVNSSDIEVNIKIALTPSLKDGSLTRPARDKLLVAMTDNVADLVLRTNYEQTLALSRTQRAGTLNLSLQAQLIQSLEKRGLLDRTVEMLPSDEEIAERRNRGEALTRAEAAVLLSYAKIVLFDDLVQSDLPDDPYLERELMRYFPTRLQRGYAENIRGHRLRREIIATVLANNTVNRGGPSVISRFEDATGALPSDIVAAHLVTREAYGLEAIHSAIDALDNKIGGDKQLLLYDDLATTHRLLTARYLKERFADEGLEPSISRLAAGFGELKVKPESYLPEFLANWISDRRQNFVGSGLPAPVATELAALPVLATAPAIIKIAEQTGRSISTTAAAYHAVTKQFKLGKLEQLAHRIDVSDYFDGLAQTRALDTIDQAHASITVAAIAKADPNDTDMTGLVARWVDENHDRIKAVQDRINTIAEGTDLTVSRLTVAAGLLSDLV